MLDHSHFVPPDARPRREILLPPAIILLVFAMVVFAVGGFTFVSTQQQALGSVRLQNAQMREAVLALSTTDAALGHVLTG